MFKNEKYIIIIIISREMKIFNFDIFQETLNMHDCTPKATKKNRIKILFIIDNNDNDEKHNEKLNITTC